jgi:hypothetical protein
MASLAGTSSSKQWKLKKMSAPRRCKIRSGFRGSAGSKEIKTPISASEDGQLSRPTSTGDRSDKREVLVSPVRRIILNWYAPALLTFGQLRKHKPHQTFSTKPLPRPHVPRLKLTPPPQAAVEQFAELPEDALDLSALSIVPQSLRVLWAAGGILLPPWIRRRKGYPQGSRDAGSEQSHDPRPQDRHGHGHVYERTKPTTLHHCAPNQRRQYTNCSVGGTTRKSFSSKTSNTCRLFMARTTLRRL